ncbi:MAG: Rieske 2Fe-2S domain-containing protein [Nitrospira sp.]|nr:Rieske 2Fe-2S domain-containing protein [Nitrospira sp.]
MIIMKDFVKVAFAHEVPPGTGRTVEVDGIWIAIFNVEGVFYAIDNSCPHAGGPLGEGALCEGVVECPWHGWKFDVTSGERVGNPNFQVTCCEVCVQGDEVQIAIPPSLREPA